MADRVDYTPTAIGKLGSITASPMPRMGSF
jgi:hypothetical protein